jgi:hypothetical protein
MEYILSLATEYETRTDLNQIDRFRLQDDLENAITSYLGSWLSNISDDMIILFGERLRRPIDYIRTRKAQLEYIWLTPKEVCVKYPCIEEPELYISVSPTHILLRDKQYGMKEIAFQFTGSTPKI